ADEPEAPARVTRRVSKSATGSKRSDMAAGATTSPWEYKRLSKSGITLVYPDFMKRHGRRGFAFLQKEPFFSLFLDPDIPSDMVSAVKDRVRRPPVFDFDGSERRLIRKGKTDLRPEAEEVVVQEHAVPVDQFSYWWEVVWREAGRTMHLQMVALGHFHEHEPGWEHVIRSIEVDPAQLPPPRKPSKPLPPMKDDDLAIAIPASVMHWLEKREKKKKKKRRKR